MGYFSVRHTPKFQKPIDLENYCCDGKPEDIYNRYDSLSFFEDFCSRKANVTLTYNKSVFDTPVPGKSSDIDLLVTLKQDPNMEDIKRIQHFYRDHFRNIIFCGHSSISRMLLNENRGRFKRFDSFTFISVNTRHPDKSAHYCMTKAIEVNFNRNKNAGILLMRDDVFIKYWNFGKLDMNKIWSPKKILIGFKDKQTLSKASFLPKNIGQLIDANSISNDESAALSNSTVVISNVFYVPKANLTQFQLLSDLLDLNAISLGKLNFIQHNLFSESILIDFFLSTERPIEAILAGLALNTNMEEIHGLYSDAKDGQPMDKAYEDLAALDRLHFAGPVTFSGNKQTDATYTRKYCEIMVQKFWIGSGGLKTKK